MSWMNEDIDELFSELAEQQSFSYKKAYFKDIERHLPLRKSRKPFIASFLLISSIVAVVLFFSNTKETSGFKQQVSAAKRTNGVIAPTSNAGIGRVPKNRPFLSRNFTNMPALNTVASEIVAKNGGFIPPTLENNFILTTEQNHTDASEWSHYSESQVPNLPLKITEIFANNQSKLLPLKVMRTLPPAPWSLVLSAYGGVSQGWTYESVAATNASIGLQTKAKYTFKRFSLQAGIGIEWMRFDHLNIMERTKIYGLSSQLIENSFAFKSMTSLQLPIAVNYTWGRHQLGVGISGVLNTVAKVKRTCSLDGQGIYTSEGYTDAALFGSLHLQSELQYNYHLTEDVSIGLAGGVRMTKPIQSDRMEGAYVQHPVYINFVLSKTFTK